MKRVEGAPREIKGMIDGKPVAVLDIQVSTTDDLPHIGDEFENYIVAEGTIAQVVQDDVFLTLDDDDNYYPSNSEPNASSLNVSPTLGKTLNESKGETIDLKDGDDDDSQTELL